jgi:hypothetical protein
MKIGFHVSIAKGFDDALKGAKALGCEVVQVFVKNPRSWERRELSDADLAAFGRLSAEMPVFAHLSYLPNSRRLTGTKGTSRDFSMRLPFARNSASGISSFTRVASRQAGGHEDYRRGDRPRTRQA